MIANETEAVESIHVELFKTWKLLDDAKVNKLLQLRILHVTVKQ